MIRKFRREDGPEQPSVLRYLENRAGKCFTVVQCETAENRGSTNACRQPVLIGGGFSRPATKDGADNDYWDHVDWVVNQAVAQGLYLAVLPTWEASRAPEHAMDRDRRIAYGCSRFLGQRYGCRSHLVWMLGGDAWQRGADMDTPALLTMIRAMTQGIADGATAISAAVENVHIKNVTCSNGTIDYFKWDPDGEQALQNPTLNFTIADADPHQYEWIIYFRKTSGSDTWTGEYWAASGEVSALWPNQDTGTSEETVSVNLADPEVSGHLAAGVHPWSTYTYDIVVRELEGEAQVDRYGLKEPYCMWIPAHPPGQTEGDGHSAWVHVPEEENAPAEMRVKYAISDQCLTPNAQDFNLIVVDPLLQERTAVGKPWPDTTGVMHGVEDVDEDGKPDGIKVYEFAPDDPGGFWRVLWTAQAPCGTTTRYRRTHDAQRMLVANQTAVKPAWAKYIYKYASDEAGDETIGHAAVGFTSPPGYGSGAFAFGFYPGPTAELYGEPGTINGYWLDPVEVDDPIWQAVEHLYQTGGLEFTSSRQGVLGSKDWIYRELEPAVQTKFAEWFAQWSRTPAIPVQPGTKRSFFAGGQGEVQADYNLTGGGHNCAQFAVVAANLQKTDAGWRRAWWHLNGARLFDLLTAEHRGGGGTYRYLRGLYVVGQPGFLPPVQCPCSACREAAENWGG